MINFREWLETRDLGRDPAGRMIPIDEIDPIQQGEDFRVYHGFYRHDDAINIARHGTSGKLRAKRVYSYESENNPKGLFVTLDVKTAQKGFASGMQPTVMQFIANEKDLDPPTWPGGSYTVQGQRAPYFYEHPSGARIGRAQKEKEDEEEARKSEWPALSQSHRPGLAQTLFGSERQALFVGHLDPKDIEGFWMQRQQNHDYRRIDDPWEFINREKFIQEFSKDDWKYPSSLGDEYAKYRAFSPNAEFKWEGLIEFLRNQYNDKRSKSEESAYNQFVGALLMGNRDFKKTMKRNEFESAFGQYIWPKQMPALHKWIRKMYKQHGKPKFNYDKA
jgi:hypothetical protein